VRHHAGPAVVELSIDSWSEEVNKARELLTPRERHVFTLLGAGRSNRAIGQDLCITERTVKAHVAQILAKLGVESRLQAGLVAYASQLTRERHHGRVVCTLLSFTRGEHVRDPRRSLTDGEVEAGVLGSWTVTAQQVDGFGVMNGEAFHSQAYGVTGAVMTIMEESIRLDFGEADREVHSYIGEPPNSWVQYTGEMSARITLTLAPSGTIAMHTDTVTGDARALKTYTDPTSTFEWSVAEAVRAGGRDGNFQSLVPVKSTFTCSGDDLIVEGEGCGTDQDGRGGHWLVRSTVTYRRV